MDNSDESLSLKIAILERDLKNKILESNIHPSVLRLIILNILKDLKEIENRIINLELENKSKGEKVTKIDGKRNDESINLSRSRNPILKASDGGLGEAK